MISTTSPALDALQTLLATIPTHRGIPTFGDTLDPYNGPQWDALRVALNGGLPVLPEMADAIQEEAAYLLGVALTLRAVREGHDLLAGLAPLPLEDKVAA